MALMLLHRMLPWSNKSVAVLLSIAGQGQYRPQHNIKMMHDEQADTAKCPADTDWRQP